MVDQATKGRLERTLVRFHFNMNRVMRLRTISEHLSDKDEQQDILRAAVVLLHASLEDVLRNLLMWKLPTDDRLLDGIDFEPKENRRNRNKITLLELAESRDKSVDDVIRAAIRAHCYERTFNNVADLVTAIEIFGLSADEYRPIAVNILPMIKRRHEIVHNSDRPEGNDEGHGTPSYIDLEMVAGWMNHVQTFCRGILKALG
jgi:hypothetical protein